MKFTDLGLDNSILKALEEKGYETPTPIQQKSIPIVLEGNDLLGVAQTGTGKTAAFAIPIIQRLAVSEKKGIKGLIVTPTRELAIQIEENIKFYAKYMPIEHTVIFGGVKQHEQVQTGSNCQPRERFKFLRRGRLPQPMRNRQVQGLALE